MVQLALLTLIVIFPTTFEGQNFFVLESEPSAVLSISSSFYNQ